MTAYENQLLAAFFLGFAAGCFCMTAACLAIGCWIAKHTRK